MMRQMENHRVLLLPPCGIPAFRHRERGWETPTKKIGLFEAMMPVTAFNLVGFPGLVVPFGLTQTYWLNDGDNSYPLSVGINTIGRLADNTVVIRDEHVSRRHCAIVVHRDGSCEVHDVASKNGTILRGRKISGPTRIRSGDELALCGRKLQFTIKFTDAVPTHAPASLP